MKTSVWHGHRGLGQKYVEKHVSQTSTPESRAHLSILGFDGGCLGGFFVKRIGKTVSPTLYGIVEDSVCGSQCYSRELQRGKVDWQSSPMFDQSNVARARDYRGR